MKTIHIFRSALVVFSALLFSSASFLPTEPIGSCIYTLGTETKTIHMRSLSVKFRTEKVGDVGKEKTNSSVGFTVYDNENGRAFVFTIKDDKVVSELKGQYPLRFPGGFNEGESLRSTGLMIVDTQNAGNTAQSMKGGSCEVLISGSTVKITIKNAIVTAHDKQQSFAFKLSTDKARVKTESQ